jgi:omega-hydroxy-beta-dihydromenaquinone-9 sulfotransferase
MSSRPTTLAGRLWHITGIQRRVFGLRVRPYLLLGALASLRSFVALTWRLDSLFYRGFKREVVDRPIFIVGNPRSGTTFLHRFLAEQGDVVGMQLYQMLVPSLTGQALLRPLLPILGALNPGKHHAAAAHETSLDALETDDAAIFLRFFDGVFLYAYFLCWDDPDPRHMFEQFEPGSPQTERDLDFYEQCLRRNLHRSGKSRVLGKLFTFPPRIDDVLRRFPDAKLIYMVRDPSETLPSGLSLVTGVQEQAFRISRLPEPTRARFLARLSEGLSLLLTRFVERYQADEIPADNLMVVRYPDLMADFEGTMNRVLEFAELDASPEFRERIREVAQRQRSRTSGHAYSLAQYGLDAQQIVDELAEVYRTFDLPPPASTSLR